MFNKKALGVHWIFFLLALIMAVVMCMSSSQSKGIPDVGKIPVELSIELEKNSNTPFMIDKVMKELSKQTISALDEEASIEDFINMFEEKYDNFKSKGFNNLDFSGIDYEFSIEKGNVKFFMKGETEDELKIPIKIGKEEEQIGKIFVNPSFRIPIDYDFKEQE